MLIRSQHQANKSHSKLTCSWHLSSCTREAHSCSHCPSSWNDVKERKACYRCVEKSHQVSINVIRSAMFLQTGQDKTSKILADRAQRQKNRNYNSLVLDALHVGNVLLALFSVEATELLGTIHRKVLHSLILRRGVL